MVARSKNLPVVNVATIYQRYPVSLIVPANSSIILWLILKVIQLANQLRMVRHISGYWHCSIRHTYHFRRRHITEIGFTQVTALLTHKFDAVVGYSNNEPIQLSNHGLQVRTFDVSDYQPLISNGIITTESTLHTQPDVVREFVQATIKGLKEVIANPQEAVQISQSYVQGMDTTNAMSVLQATIPIWQGDGKNPLGYNNNATWRSMEQFLVTQKIIPTSLDISQAYSNTSLS